jgi:hypothetical protein
MSGDTATFAFSVTYSGGIYSISQPTNGNLICTYPQGGCLLKTHFSDPQLYYFGSSGNSIALNYTLCTNLTTASRLAQFDAILALASAAPIGAVTISGQPVGVTRNENLGEVYSLTATRSSSGAALVLRPNATTAKLGYLSCSTNTALSSGNSFYVTSGATITGGTWAASSLIPGSKMEVNTGGAVSGGAQQLFFLLGTSSIQEVLGLNVQYTTLQPIVVGINQSGIGSTSVSLTWTELP